MISEIFESFLSQGTPSVWGISLTPCLTYNLTNEELFSKINTLGLVLNLHLSYNAFVVQESTNPKTWKVLVALNQPKPFKKFTKEGNIPSEELDM